MRASRIAYWTVVVNAGMLAILSPLSGAPKVKADKPLVIVDGNFASVVKEVLKDWGTKAPQPIKARLAVSGDLWPITFIIFDSRHSEYAGPKDNCVASPFDKLVECDLKIVDDLIKEFGIVTDYKTERQKQNMIKQYRRDLITWILAHEIGHIVLRHGISDYLEPKKGFAIFNESRQKDELAADAFAISLIGGINANTTAYSTIIYITNMLILRSVCPNTFPIPCREMPPGVGIIFNYTQTAKPIKISLGESHPAFIARFLRILYLAGVPKDNGISYEASEVIDQLEVNGPGGSWIGLKDAFK